MERIKGDKLFSINPSKGEIIDFVQISTPEEIEEAFNRAEEAFIIWRKTPIEERIIFIEKAGEIIYEEMEEIAELISIETGKPLLEAYLSDLLSSFDAIKFYSKNSKKILKREIIRFNQPHLIGKKAWVEYEPFGTVAVITPWNYPFSIPITTLVPVLIAGNTVLFKPSEFTPLIGRKIMEIFDKARLPKGVLNVIFGDGSAGIEIIKKPIKKVFFTGSTSTGKKIMRECAERLIPVTFELGGKDSMIILKDADIDFATEAALWGSFFNCGQTCASVERIYIEREILEPFLEKLIGKTKRLKIGIDIGPLQNEKQFSKVKEHLEDALMKGGKIVYQIDFKSEKGLFFPPTIILNLNEEMKCLREETFGPLIRIISVENWKEAIELTNASNMGLSSSIWTENIELAKEIAKEIQAGTIWINNLFYSYNATQCPWGGVKESGIGRVHGKHSLYEATYPKLMSVEKGKKKGELWWFPYDEKKLMLFKRWIEFLFGKKLSIRIKSLLRLIRIVFRKR